MNLKTRDIVVVLSEDKFLESLAYIHRLLELKEATTKETGTKGEINCCT